MLHDVRAAMKEDEREAKRKAKEVAEKAERDEKEVVDAKKAAETNDQLEILRAAVSASVRERGGGVGMRVVPSGCARWLCQVRAPVESAPHTVKLITLPHASF